MPDPWTAHRLRPPARRSPASVARLAMRTRDPAPAEALARVATQGRLGEAELLARVLTAGPDPAGWPVSPRRERVLLSLASVWAVTPAAPDRLRAAALVFEHLLDAGFEGLLRAEHHLQAGQAMLLSGRHDALRRLLPSLRLPGPVQRALRTDLVNPWLPVSAATADPQAWAALFAEPFEAEGQVAPRVAEPADADDVHPFDRLHAPDGLPGSASGDLVTVVMPCYRPDRGLLSSVRSIAAQTWADLEILLVDDASGPDFEPVFAEAAALDRRVRRITMERNGGSYLAREAAIAQARGTWVTFQDADDWSHPSRIEHQVELVRDRPDGVSRSMAVRAHDDLSLQWVGYSPVRPNASSLLLHRSVLERCGGFVPIRKGADSELAERVAHLGSPVADTGTVLAITRLRHGSLSRADFTYSWMAPDRVAFRSAFRAWHRHLETHGAEPAELSTEALHRLPFAVPRTFLRDLPGAALTPAHHDVAYLGDLSQDERAASRWLRESALPGLEGTVGLWHQESPTAPHVTRPTLSDAWSDLAQADPRLRPLTRVEDVTVDHLVVLDPEVLAMTTTQACRVRAGRVDLCLTPELVLPDRSLLPADVLGLADRAREWLGVRRPRWVLAPWLTPEEQQLVLEAVPGLVTDAPDLPANAPPLPELGPALSRG